MNFDKLLEHLLTDTLDASVPGFKPELTLCVTIVLMLLARLPSWGRKLNAFYIALPGVLVALYYAAPWVLLHTLEGRTELFTGLLVYDKLTVFFRSVLLVFAVLFLLLTRLTGIPDREDSPDFYTLVLGSTLGMCVMASANHLLMVFLGVEMASVPSYALAGILKGRRQSSEAALKYAIYGAGAAGVMLYGISLLAGALGSCHLPTMAHLLATLPADAFAERQTVLTLGGLMVSVGLAFKLSAFPFHFWCPDVFEGASAEVNAFLSVASKAAALGLLVRVAFGFAHVPSDLQPPVPAAEAEAAVTAKQKVHLVSYRAEEDAGETETDDVEGKADDKAPAVELEEAPLAEGAVGSPGLAPVRRYLIGLITLFSAVTCTFGNLAAYSQTNIKRLLAYSTIAHAGYMMMPVVAAVGAVRQSAGGGRSGDLIVGRVCVRLPVHEPGRLCHRGLPAEYDAQRGNRRLQRVDLLLPRRRGLFHIDPDQPDRLAPAGRLCRQIPGVRLSCRITPVSAARDRRHQHGDQPVLLSTGH